MTTEEIRDFFANAPAQIQGNGRIREPQLEGYDYARRHFGASRERAVLQIPVGCGKTGLMGILPFGLAEGRVLIIAPNLEIRRGIAEELDYTEADCFWTKAGVWASPGYIDTPNRTESAIGVSHGEEAEAAIVLAGVQSGSGQGGAGEWQERQHGGA